MGPSLLLKVMSGDKIDLGVQEYYNSGSTGTPNTSLTDVLASLATGVVNMTSGGKGSLADLNNTGASPIYAALNSLLTNKDTLPVGKPKAYLNWILLDEQLKYVNSYPQSGAITVGAAGTLNSLANTGIPITKSGYLYIWVSNETPNWDLFFDNLAVKHYTGPMLEETHFYPFGLTMAGISSKALKPYYAENKYKFNKGTELQNQEFSDGSGLELYETNFRSLDPQLGRFWQIDALGQTLPSLSPYQFANDNPIYFNDPFGLLSDSLHPQELPTVVVTPQKKSDNTSAWQLGWEWMTGTGAREHHFHDNDPFTKMLKKHEHVQDVRSQIVTGLSKHKIDLHKKYLAPYNLGGFSGVPKYLRDYSTLLTAGMTGNIAVTYLGSYGLQYEVLSVDEESGTAQVHFTVSNSSTMASFFHAPVIGYTKWWGNTVGKTMNSIFSTGPGSLTSQTVDWTETIQWKGDK
jgi:RHS repeat-associated protein